MRKLFLGGIFLSFFLINCFSVFVYSQTSTIVLRIIVVNPSKEDSRIVPVKAYLPKEAKPEDVVSRGDLDIGYDTQQGSYYVYGSYELAPSEALEREIEIRDIWTIPNEEIISLRAEAEEVNNLMKNTELADRISFLYNSIVTKLDQLEQRQGVQRPNPEDHISQYRHNEKLLESIKADLALARSMLDKAKPFSTAMIWKVMLFIIIFLGLLGVSFYFLWQKQVKVMDEGILEPDGMDQQTQGEKPSKEGEQKEAKKDKDQDIEDILKGE